MRYIAGCHASFFFVVYSRGAVSQMLYMAGCIIFRYLLRYLHKWDIPRDIFYYTLKHLQCCEMSFDYFQISFVIFQDI